MVWLGVRARCFHNEVRCYLPTQYLKIEFGTFCQIIAAPPSGSGKALGDNLEGACSIFLQKRFILVRHIYWIFRLLRGGWLGCTRAFVKWHLWPYPLNLFLLWSTATTHPHCHCTPRHPRARARSPRLVKPLCRQVAPALWHLAYHAKPSHPCLAWYGAMAWGAGSGPERKLQRVGP